MLRPMLTAESGSFNAARPKVAVRISKKRHFTPFETRVFSIMNHCYNDCSDTRDRTLRLTYLKSEPHVPRGQCAASGDSMYGRVPVPGGCTQGAWVGAMGTCMGAWLHGCLGATGP